MGFIRVNSLTTWRIILTLTITHPDINRYMLYAIEKNHHRISLQNLDAYEKAMIDNLKKFEVQDSYPKKDTLTDLINNEMRFMDE